jgi:hypothetical protein
LIISSWNLEKYKNKNVEEFLDEYIIFISVLIIDRGVIVLRESDQLSSDYDVFYIGINK